MICKCGHDEEDHDEYWGGCIINSCGCEEEIVQKL